MTREEFIQEMKLRKFIRKAITIAEKKNKIKSENQALEEQKLRKVIRRLIQEKEVDADTKPVPYKSTAMNVLTDVLNVILPIIKTNQRKLTTDPEERQSFREHMLQTFKDFFDTLESRQVVGPEEEPETVPETEPEMELEEAFMEEEKIDIEVGDTPEDDAEIVPDFEKEKPKKKGKKEEEDDEFEDFKIVGRNTTGARVAFDAINSSNAYDSIEKGYKLFDKPEDKEEYRNYFLYNIDLWMVKYEKELASELGQSPAFADSVVEKPQGAVDHDHSDVDISNPPEEDSQFGL